METNLVHACYLMFTLLMVGGWRWLLWWYARLLRFSCRVLRIASDGRLWEDFGPERLSHEETQDWVLLSEKMFAVPGGTEKIRMRHWQLKKEGTS